MEIANLSHQRISNLRYKSLSAHEVDALSEGRVTGITNTAFRRHEILNIKPSPTLASPPLLRARQHCPTRDTLVVVFLRGAADVLNMVVPHGEDAYYQLRPSLGIPRPDDLKTKKEDEAVDLDGFFGLHPTMQPLLEAWQSEQLAVIHACGAPDESRSHFKAMELMERGVDDERGPASGWIGRHLATLNTGNSSPLRAVGMGTRPQRSLSGSVPVSALRSIADFHLGGDPRALQQMRAALDTVYAEDVLGQETLSIMDTLQKLDPTNYQSLRVSRYGIRPRTQTDRHAHQSGSRTRSLCD